MYDIFDSAWNARGLTGHISFVIDCKLIITHILCLTYWASYYCSHIKTILNSCNLYYLNYNYIMLNYINLNY